MENGAARYTRQSQLPQPQPRRPVCAHVIMVWRQTSGEDGKPWTSAYRQLAIRCTISTPHDIHKAGPVVWE